MERLNRSGVTCDEQGDVMESEKSKNEVESGSRVVMPDATDTRKWISVKDRLPRDSDHVIINYRSICARPDPVDKVDTGFYMRFNTIWTRRDGQQLSDVTHWMPLPELPEQV